MFGASRWLDAEASSGIAAAASAVTQRTGYFMVSSLVFSGLDMSPCHADCSQTKKRWMQGDLRFATPAVADARMKYALRSALADGFKVAALSGGAPAQDL